MDIRAWLEAPGEPEPLVSRMRVTHSMLLNVIARPGDPAAAMRRLLRDNHEDERSQRRLMRLAAAQHRSLLAAGVVRLGIHHSAASRISQSTISSAVPRDQSMR